MISIRDVVIDPEFEALIPPMADTERMELMKSIEREGFRDTIVVWLNHGTLLDGHNRYRIWQDCYANEPDREPAIHEMHFADREAAKRWIILNQLGRRNLAPEQSSYLRGLLYEATKQQVPSPTGRRGKGIDGQNGRQIDTAASVASETGVSPRTIRRDAQFVKAVGAIAAVAPEAKDAILCGKVKVPHQELVDIGKMPEDDRKKAVDEALSKGFELSTKLAPPPGYDRKRPIPKPAIEHFERAACSIETSVLVMEREGFNGVDGDRAEAVRQKLEALRTRLTRIIRGIGGQEGA